MSAVERKYYLQWRRPTEDKALARLGRPDKKPAVTLLRRVDMEINRLLTEAREGRIGTRDFWIKRNRVLKGELL